ncbi:MAG: L-threonylcarbamoyladenylate synthase [Gemmatimonadota bacterium]|nr:L-threonylcarbamoyladenylate synthase [Gemmatimonadota bacterium]
MNERVIRLGNECAEFSRSWVGEAASLLERATVVVHPTETVHGLGCRYDCRAAIERIAQLKGRKEPGRMILLVPGPLWLDTLCNEVPDVARKLARHFWPGPLTLVLKTADSARRKVPWLGTTVALRQCGHPFTSRVVEKLGLPVVSTSFNLTGQQAEHSDPQRNLEILAEGWKKKGLALPELAVMDRNISGQESLPSTILAVRTGGPLLLLREGVIGVEEIKARAMTEVVTE